MGTFWDIWGQFRRLLDEFGTFRLFSQSFRTIFTGSLKKTPSGRTHETTEPRTDGRTDSYKYAWTHNKIALNSARRVGEPKHILYFPSLLPFKSSYAFSPSSAMVRTVCPPQDSSSPVYRKQNQILSKRISSKSCIFSQPSASCLTFPSQAPLQRRIHPLLSHHRHDCNSCRRIQLHCCCC